MRDFRRNDESRDDPSLQYQSEASQKIREIFLLYTIGARIIAMLLGRCRLARRQCTVEGCPKRGLLMEDLYAFHGILLVKLPDTST